MPTTAPTIPGNQNDNDDPNNPANRLREREAHPQTSDKAFDDLAKNYEKNTADSAQEDRNVGAAREKLDPPQKVASGSRKRRNWIIGLIGSSIVGAAVSIFGFLSPFKVPALVQAAADEAGQRVEQVTIHQAKVIMARAILTKFGIRGGPVITGKGPVASLIATLRVNGFEKRLAAKGLQIELTENGVKLTQNGKPLGGGKELKDAPAVQRAIDGEASSRQVINTIVREDIPTWRIFKRMKFATWLKIKYGISRFRTENSKEPDDTKATQEMQSERLQTSYGRAGENALEGIDCILAENNCPVQEGDKGIKESDAPEVADDIKKAGSEIADEAKTTLPGDMVKKLTGLLPEKLTKLLAAKEIPVFGWFDLAATVDHIAWSALNDDYFAKIPSYFREKSQAQMYGDWQGYSDQIKAGAMMTGFAGVLAVQITGAEASLAHNYISGHPDQGQALDNDEKINSNNPSAIKESWEKVKDIQIPGFTPGISHAVMNAYYETIGGGGLIGFFSERLGALATWLTPDFVNDWFRSAVSAILNPLLSIMGLTADPMTSGPKLYNFIHAGATASYNAYCKVMGCRLLTAAQTGAANQKIAAERADEIKQKGWMYALFSPDSTQSVTNQLAIAMPSSLAPSTFNLSDGMSQLASLVFSTPAKAFGLLSGQASANTKYVDLYGIDPYGMNDDDAAMPLAEETITGDDCPEVAEGTYNNCVVGKTVAEAMLCGVVPSKPGCGIGAGSENATATTPPNNNVTWPIDKADWPGDVYDCDLEYSGGLVHTGIDISVPSGTALRAAVSGTVSLPSPSYGMVDIKFTDASGQTLYANYQHLSRILVTAGQQVTQGTLIGYSGSTGAESAHLHFSIWDKELLSGWDPVNSAAGKATLSHMRHPMNYLPDDGRNTSTCKGPPFDVPDPN